MQFAALSNRPHVVYERALEASLYPANLATLVVPNIFGSHQFPHWGPNYETEPAVAAVDESFNYLFVGSVPVVLLLWFGIAGGGLWRRGRVLMSAVLRRRAALHARPLYAAVSPGRSTGCRA